MSRLPRTLPPSSCHEILTGKTDVLNEFNGRRGRQCVVSSRAKWFGILALELGHTLESFRGFKT